MTKDQIGTTEIDKNVSATHTVYLVKNVDGKACFEQIGTLRPHVDGRGFNQSIAFHDWDISLLIRENR